MSDSLSSVPRSLLDQDVFPPDPPAAVMLRGVGSSLSLAGDEKPFWHDDTVDLRGGNYKTTPDKAATPIVATASRAKPEEETNAATPKAGGGDKTAAVTDNAIKERPFSPVQEDDGDDLDSDEETAFSFCGTFPFQPAGPSAGATLGPPPGSYGPPPTRIIQAQPPPHTRRSRRQSSSTTTTSSAASVVVDDDDDGENDWGTVDTPDSESEESESESDGESPSSSTTVLKKDDEEQQQQQQQQEEEEEDLQHDQQQEQEQEQRDYVVLYNLFPTHGPHSYMVKTPPKHWCPRIIGQHRDIKEEDKVRSVDKYIEELRKKNDDKDQGQQDKDQGQQDKDKDKDDGNTIFFVVVRDWDCYRGEKEPTCTYDSGVKVIHHGPRPRRMETVRPVTPALTRLLASLALCPSDLEKRQADPTYAGPIRCASNAYSPRFLWHHREALVSALMADANRKDVEALLGFMARDSAAVQRTSRCDAEFSMGLVSKTTLAWLFRPNEVVVVRDIDWIKEGANKGEPAAAAPTPGGTAAALAGVVKTWPSLAHGSKADNAIATFSVWEWTVSGGVARRMARQISIQGPPRGHRVPITSLAVYPLRFASEETKARLLASGQTYRDVASVPRKLVSYSGFDVAQFHCFPENSRFMIDEEACIETTKPQRGTPDYGNPHNRPPKFPEAETVKRRGDSWPVECEVSSMSGDMTMMLPAKIPGFSLEKHMWVYLDVGKITRVKWDKQAFGRLVLPEATTTLMQSIFMGQAKRQRQSNWATLPENGKPAGGMSLIIHGPRGIGKTAAVEGAAELAELGTLKLTRQRLNSLDGFRIPMGPRPMPPLGPYPPPHPRGPNRGGVGGAPTWDAFYVNVPHILMLASRWGLVLLIDDFFVVGNTERDELGSWTVSQLQKAVETHRGICAVTLPDGADMSRKMMSRGNHLVMEFKPPREAERAAIWAGVLDRMGRENGGAVVDRSDSALFNAHVELTQLEFDGRRGGGSGDGAARRPVVAVTRVDIGGECCGKIYGAVDDGGKEVVGKPTLSSHQLTGRQIVAVADAARRLAEFAGRGVRLEDFELVLRSTQF